MPNKINYKRAICPEGMSYCSKCQKYDVNDNFPNAKKGPNGKSWWCKSCVKKHAVGKSNIMILYNKQKNYGISEKEYLELLEKQGGVCAICGDPETKIYRGKVGLLTVDHDHQDGHVRGLLCSVCNSGLGMFKDDIHLLKKAVDYLLEKGGHRIPKAPHVQRTSDLSQINELTAEVTGLPKQIKGKIQDTDGLPMFE